MIHDVNSEINPADRASRKLLPDEIEKLEKWPRF